MSKSSIQILLFEDNPLDVVPVESTLAKFSTVTGIQFTLLVATSLREGLLHLEQADIDVVLLDLGLPDSDGYQTFESVLKKARTTPVVVLTGNDNDVTAMKALQNGAQDFLIKGQAHGPPLIRSIRNAMERKKAEEAFNASEEKFRTIVETTHEWIWEVDCELVLTFTNPAVKSLLGYDLVEVLGKRLRDLIIPQDQTAFARFMQMQGAQKKPWRNHVCRYRHLDGSLRICESSGVPILSSGGLLQGFRGFQKDVTESRLAEENLRKEKEFSDLTINSLPGIFCVLDHDFRLIKWNQNFELTQGIRAEAILHSHFSTLFIARDQQEIASALEEAIRQGYSTVEANLDFGPQKPAPHLFLFRSMAADRSSSGIIVVGMDISARKKAEEGLALVAAIVNGSGDAIVGQDTDGWIVSWNTGAQNLFGYHSSEALGRGSELMFGENDVKFGDLRRRVLRMGRVERKETEARTRDGSVVQLSIAVSPIVTAAGQTIGSSAIIRNITEQQRAQQALQSSIKEKDVLLREIHHRVKNNMQIISSLLELHSDYISDPEALASYRESQNRIQSMALIHERLYQSKDLTGVNIQEYIQSLVSMLLRSQDADKTRWHCRFEVEDLVVGIDTAIPLGLVLNELVSCVLKSRPPEGQLPQLKISLHKIQSAYSLNLYFSGEESMAPGDAKDPEEAGFSQRLVELLSAQLKGKLERAKIGMFVEYTLVFEEI